MKYRLLILSLLLTTLIACQSKNKVSGFDGTNGGNSTGSTLLSCSKYQGSELAGRVVADPNSSDYVFLTFTINPTELSNTAAGIRIYAGLDVNPTTGAGFVVYDSYTKLALSSYITAGTKITQAFLDSLNNNSTLNLNQVTFHVNVGPMNRALRVAFTEGTTIYDDVNMLIPSYDANPNTYATSHSSTLLALHPLLPYKSLSWTDEQFKSQGEYLCTQ